MPAPPDEPPPNPVLLAVLIEGGLAVVAALAGWWLDRPPLWLIHWDLTDLVWGLLATGPLVVGGLLVYRFPWGPLRELVKLVRTQVVPLFRGCRVVDLAIIAALAGLGEELLFRGIIQRLLAEWVGEPSGWWVGLATAALLFGLAHALTPTYALLAGFIGLYLGGLWLATDNLLVPVMTHAAYDFVALVYLVKIRGSKPDPE